MLLSAAILSTSVKLNEVFVSPEIVCQQMAIITAARQLPFLNIWYSKMVEI